MPNVMNKGGPALVLCYLLSDIDRTRQVVMMEETTVGPDFRPFYRHGFM